METEKIMDEKRNIDWDGNKETGHADRAHSSVVGGSSAARVIACPGSVALSTYFSDPEDSAYAAEGTALHEAIEHILTSDIEDVEIIGHNFNGFEITKKMYDEAIAPALDFLDDLQDEFGVELGYVTEQRVAIPEINGAFGTVDMAMKSPDQGIILDWKFGAGVTVDAEDNKQMLFYAHGARSDPEIGDMFPRDKPVEIIIAQPRIEGGFKRWVTDHTQIDIFVKELTRAVVVARDGLVIEFAADLMSTLADIYNPEFQEPELALHALKQDLADLNEQYQSPVFKTGDHCRWCRAKKGCPIKNISANLVLTMPEAELRENLGEMLGVAEDLKDWIREIEQWAFKTMEDGLDVPGWKLVAKVPRRKWVDEAGAYTHFSNLRSVKADEFAPRKILTVAAMEKLLKGKSRELPKDLVLKESSGLKMVPEGDKGEAVNLTPKMLEGLTEYLN